MIGIVTYWSFCATNNEFKLYDRGANEVVWSTTKLTFREAKDLTDAVDRIHRQGIDAGKELVARKVREVMSETP